MYMIDDRDAEDAIKDLDGQEFGRQRRRLVVQWAKVPEMNSHPLKDSRYQLQVSTVMHAYMDLCQDL